MSHLLFFDQLRGKDATGVASVKGNGALSLFKRTIPGSEFINEPGYDRIISFADKLWIGHNRWGTIGKNIKNNAHPFWVLDDDDAWILVGAHNGTLKNRHDLKDYDKFGTDSEALFNAIAETDAKTAIAQVDGAWALTWACNYTDTLNVLRNKERTLFYAFTKDKKTLVWASEKWMIIVSCMKGGLEIDEVQSFDEDTLYVFPIDLKNNQEVTFETKGGYTGKQVGFFQPRNQSEGKGWWAPEAVKKRQQEELQRSQQREELRKKIQGPHSTTPSTTTPSTGSSDKPLNTNSSASTPPETSGTPNGSGQSSDNVTGIRPYKGFKGERLSKKQLEDALAEGCCFCETEVIEVTDRFGWLGHNKAVCSKCLDGDYADDEYSKMFVSMEMLKKTIH